jgi:uncharacterized membrane protein YccC
VLGTFIGILLGSLLAHAVGPSTWSLAVILPAITFGVYFLRVSYSLMAIGITIVVSMLYVQLGEFSNHLLVTRLELTALGAVVAMLAALLIFPVSTRRVLRQAVLGYLDALNDLIGRVCDALAAPSPPRMTSQARVLDDALQQMLITARPLTRDPFARHDIEHNLALLTTTANLARNLIAAIDTAPPLDKPTLARLQSAIGAQRDAIHTIAARVRGDATAATIRPQAEAIIQIARHLNRQGIVRSDPRRRLLRALARLDTTLDQLARNLNQPTPTHGIPRSAPSNTTPEIEAAH